MFLTKNSESDQEIPQSQTADNPVAPEGRAAQPVWVSDGMYKSENYILSDMRSEIRFYGSAHRKTKFPTVYPTIYLPKCKNLNTVIP